MTNFLILLHFLYIRSSSTSIICSKDEYKRFENQPHLETSKNFEIIPYKSNRTKKSECWTYFHLYKHDDKSKLPITCDPSKGVFANCNICGANINVRKQISKRSSTSGMINHLLTHKLVINQDTLRSKRNLLPAIFGKSKMPRYTNQKEKDSLIVHKTVEWICMDLQPISCVESSYFRDMMTINNPGYKPISNKTVIKTLFTLDDQIRSRVLQIMTELNPWISVTVDHWTSVSNHNYTGMTIHWIGKDCCLNNLQLGCWLHEGNSSATTLVDDFLSKLFQKCRLSSAKISAVVSDTTANMNLFGQILKDINVPHIYCTDHIIQCTTKKAFANSNYISTDQDSNHNGFRLMSKCRSLVELFSKSCQKQELLLKQQSKMDLYRNKLPLRTVADVCTRWWSTHAMISRLLYLKPAMDCLKADNQIPNNLCLIDEEWSVIKDILSVLKPFKTAQKFLEGDKFVTISYIPLMIENIDNKLQEILTSNGTNENVKKLIQNLISDFYERWGYHHTSKFNPEVVRGYRNRQIGVHPLVIICTALDPRLKNLTFIETEEEKETVWNSILSLMIEIMKENGVGAPTAVSNSSNHYNSIQNECDLDSDTEDFFDSIEESQNLCPTQNRLGCPNNDEHCREMCLCELNAYKQAKLLEIYDHSRGLKKTINCPLRNFWLIKKDQFPTLFELAMKYLCIPATSAPSERVFSVASKIISKFRNRLSPDIAGSILFIHGSLEWYKEEIQKESNQNNC